MPGLFNEIELLAWKHHQDAPFLYVSTTRTDGDGTIIENGRHRHRLTRTTIMCVHSLFIIKARRIIQKQPCIHSPTLSSTGLPLLMLWKQRRGSRIWPTRLLGLHNPFRQILLKAFWKLQETEQFRQGVESKTIVPILSNYRKDSGFQPVAIVSISKKRELCLSLSIDGQFTVIHYPSIPSYNYLIVKGFERKKTSPLGFELTCLMGS